MKTIILSTAAALFFQILKSQQPADSLKIQGLNEVVVTATKTSVSRNNVGYSVSVVNQNSIEQSSESALLPVLSESVPGLFITERGITGFGVATGSAGQISMRGVGGSPSTQVLVLLNGNPQFMGLMGHPLPDSYVASDAQRVEVIRGPASTLYGSNAMGGVINIITKNKQDEGLSLNSRLMYGSYNTMKAMVNGGFRKNKFNVFASFNHDRTDGHRDSSEFTINNGYIRAGYQISEALTVNADFSLANYTASDPGPDYSKAGYEIDITRGMGAVSIDNNYNRSKGSLRFFYNFGIHDITDGFHSDDNNYGWIFYQSLNIFKGNTITVGVDGKNYGGRARQESKIIGDTTVWEVAGYAFMQQDLGTKFSLNGGFRLEHNSVYGNEPVPSVGAAWRPFTSTTVKASVSKGFRSPTIRELYLFPPANEDLKPERMVNVEAGILQKINNKLQFELTVFRAKGSNLIKTLVNAGKPLNVNTGSFTNTGLEFSAKWQVAQRLSFTGNYSYIHMDTPIIATPEVQATSTLFYKVGLFDVSLTAQNIFNLYTQTAPSEIIEDYTLINSRIACNLSRTFSMFVKIENMFDTKYYINYGYPMPGFLAFGGINLHF